MRAFTTAAIALAACFAGAQALAAPQAHLSDVQFVQANRCVGLMSSKALGTPDVAAMRQLVKDQLGSRMAFIYDRADEARDDAQRQADRAGPDNSRLVAERDGVCHALIEANAGGGAHVQARMLR